MIKNDENICDIYEKSRDRFIEYLTVLENIVYSIVPHKEYDPSIKPYTQLECNAIRLCGVVNGDQYYASRTQFNKARSKNDIYKMNEFINGMDKWYLEIHNLLKDYKDSEEFKNLNKCCRVQIPNILKESRWSE